MAKGALIALHGCDPGEAFARLVDESQSRNIKLRDVALEMECGQDRRNRYRLELALDLERLRAAVGEDTVVLFRKHHYIIDPVPTTEDGFVRDVSAYPDGTELMLAADVLMTDYSSMMVDFANTGRPMLFFTYDLDAYEDEIRGFYLDDFVGTVPGPLLRTTDEVAEALQDLDGVRAQYADRYSAFREAFCELDDGHAAARVVDRLF